jgi:hypothetical protein
MSAKKAKQIVPQINRQYGKVPGMIKVFQIFAICESHSRGGKMNVLITELKKRNPDSNL